MKLVETKKSELYKLMYLLLKLVLLLPVVTASVERVFSMINIVKSNLRTTMGDQYTRLSIIMVKELRPNYITFVVIFLQI